MARRMTRNDGGDKDVGRDAEGMAIIPVEHVIKQNHGRWE
jgi:hypothetical protein